MLNVPQIENATDHRNKKMIKKNIFIFLSLLHFLYYDLIQLMCKVVLESYYQLADSDRCVAESRGGLLHELFHVFGVGFISTASLSL